MFLLVSVFSYIIPVKIYAKVVKYMRTGKDIDFTKVDFITYAVGEYYNDIPIYDVVIRYINLFQIDEDNYFGEFINDDGAHQVRVNKKTNECSIDYEIVNPEEFIILFEGEEVDPVPIIKKITGVDLDEYISDVTYDNGTTELLDVKGKTLLIGDWKRVTNESE